MYKTILLGMIFVLCYGNEANTTFQQESAVSIGREPIGIDEVGRAIYEINASVATRNYLVPTLLAQPKIRNDEIIYSKGTRIDLLSTKLTLHIAIDGDTPVYETNLSENGGSGERPFLLPWSASNIPEGEPHTFWFEVVDSNAPSFDPNEAEKFYPLDVERSERYTTSGDSERCRGFFGFFTCTIDRFFQRTIGKKFIGEATESSIDQPARRRNYLANIFYGLEKPHLVKKSDPIDTSVPAANTPVSLLHYDETSSQGCSAGFPVRFDFGSDSLICSFIKTFAFDRWMPFVEVQDTQLDYHRIQEDTRLTLLALMGYKSQKTHQSFFQYFLDQLFKPLRQFISLFFPYAEPTTTQILDRNLSTDKPLLLALPIVNEEGDKVAIVRTFRLLYLHESLVKKVDGCQRRFSWGFFTGPWEDRNFEECRLFIDRAIDEATENQDISILQQSIKELSQLFSFFFPKYQYRGTTTTYTKLGITLQPHTPSLREGNPILLSVRYGSGSDR